MKRDLYALAQTHKLYILINDIPVATAYTEEWMFWMREAPIEKTTLPSGREIITTFMGYCGEHRESQPLTFATIFKPEPLLTDFTVVLEWYYTWKEALEAHARYVKQHTDPRTGTQKLSR